MKSFLYLLSIATMLILPALLSQPANAIQFGDSGWQLRGRSETSLEWYQVDGHPGSAAKDEDVHWRQELGLNLTRRLQNGSFGLDLRGRGTDDEQIDSDDARLLYMRVYRMWDNGGIELGDVAASYNPLVFSGAAKGGKFEYRGGTADSGLDFSLLGGLQKPDWKQTYDSSADESVDRYVSSANVTWKHAAAQSVSTSFSWVKDDKATVPTVTGTTSINGKPVEASTVGFEANWRFNRYLRLRCEAGYTVSDQDTSDHIDASEDTAIRLKLLTKPSPRAFRSNFFYERLGTDYKPIIATATSDRERIENDSEWMINRELRLRTTLKFSRDNLDNQLGDTQNIHDGALYLTYRPDWMKRGDFGLRGQAKRIDGRGSDQHLQSAEVNFNNRPASGWRYGMAYIFTHINDNSANANVQKINTARGNLGWRQKLGEDHMLRMTLTLDGNFLDRDNSDDTTTLGGRIDLGYDAGNLWSLDLRAATRNTDLENNGDNRYDNYQLRADYHPGEDRSKSIRLTVERRDYERDSIGTASSNAAGSYTEDITRLAYLVSF